MPRIPLVTEASMTDAQRRVYEAMMTGPRRSPPVGPLAAAMHRPDLAEKWSDLGLVLRFNSSFPPRLREFVILLTGRFWDCQLECSSYSQVFSIG
jgi:4-carboxymuconolactone decarboxylase